MVGGIGTWWDHEGQVGFTWGGKGGVTFQMGRGNRNNRDGEAPSVTRGLSLNSSGAKRGSIYNVQKPTNDSRSQAAKEFLE